MPLFCFLRRTAALRLFYTVKFCFTAYGISLLTDFHSKITLLRTIVRVRPSAEVVSIRLGSMVTSPQEPSAGSPQPI